MLTSGNFFGEWEGGGGGGAERRMGGEPVDRRPVWTSFPVPDPEVCEGFPSGVSVRVGGGGGGWRWGLALGFSGPT